MFLFSSVDCHLIVSTSAAPLDRFSLRPTQIPGDQIRSELLLTSQTREHLFVFLTDSSSDSSSSGKRNKKQILVLQDPSCCLTAPFYPLCCTMAFRAAVSSSCLIKPQNSDPPASAQHTRNTQELQDILHKCTPQRFFPLQHWCVRYGGLRFG